MWPIEHGRRESTRGYVTNQTREERIYPRICDQSNTGGENLPEDMTNQTREERIYPRICDQSNTGGENIPEDM
eukprot:4130634-Pyramimonas_sp.AAC.1